jgi:molybdopterin-guanine dinucleotide biosynthesis protein A
MLPSHGMTRQDESELAAAPLCGLVLAGGQSLRMGRDKGSLSYRGEPQATRAWRMLAAVCGDAYVSIREVQAALPTYRELPLIVDDDLESLGPAAGLLAAWKRRPDVAWLVLATDLPFVDTELLRELIDGREPKRLATAFRHPDGVPEPLCAIWEPRACEALRERVRSGDRSLRRLLTTATVALIDADDPRRLASVDGATDYEVAQRQLALTDRPR